MRRLGRRSQPLHEEKSLGPSIGGVARDTNPMTARDADKDRVVLEGLPTINMGRGVPDPTPFGSGYDDGSAVASMTDASDSFSKADPFNHNNPDGFFPGEKGPIWKSLNVFAMNVAPTKMGRLTAPASMSNFHPVEHTEWFFDAVRDKSGVWNPPPPPEQEVELSVYRAFKKEILEVGGHNSPYPENPTAENFYEQDMSWMKFTRKALMPEKHFPFHMNHPASWRDGDPLYHALPTNILNRVKVQGLVARRESSGETGRRLWLAGSPSVWNDEFPEGRDSYPRTGDDNSAADGSPVGAKTRGSGMSFLRITPTESINTKLGKMAEILNSSAFPTAYLDEDGNAIPGNREERGGREVDSALMYQSAVFNNETIPPENIEVLSQSGEWISLQRANMDPAEYGANASMSTEKNSRINRLFNRFKDRNDDPRPAPVAPVTVDLPPESGRAPYPDRNLYGGDELIIAEQRTLSERHQMLALADKWSEIHGDHYDWWAYPIDNGSASYGETYNVAGEPLIRLRRNEEFLGSLAKAIEIQALALGWSLYENKFVEDLKWEKGQDWRAAYPTRFYKFTRSAQIFGLEREFESLLTLKEALSDAGINFNHEEYWSAPGTIDDVPPIFKRPRSYPETSRFAASDSAEYSPPARNARAPKEETFYEGLEEAGIYSPFSSSRSEDDYEEMDPFSAEISHPTIAEAEELADILSEDDDMMESGRSRYPYERISKDDRTLLADDIFFALSLVMDGSYPDEEAVDRLESADTLRRYVSEMEGLYPDDLDTLNNLADSLEDPTMLSYTYESEDDGSASMASRRRSPERQKRLELIAKLYDEGATVEEIMERTGLTQKYTVSNAIRSAEKMGLITKKRKKGPIISLKRRKQLELVAKLHDEGARIEEIMKRTGSTYEQSKSSLEQAMRMGLIKRKPDYEESALDRAKTVAALYQNGTTYDEMATTTGMTRTAVGYFLGVALEMGFLQSLNRKNRNMSEGRIKRITEVARLLNEGMTQPEVAEELSISVDEVRQDKYYAVNMRLLSKPLNRRRANMRGSLRKRTSEDDGNASMAMSPERREQVELVAKLYDEGSSTAEIMERTGLSRVRVGATVDYAGKLGLIESIRQQGPRMSPERREQMELVAKLYDEGATVEEIMEQTGLSRKQVGRTTQRAKDLGSIKNIRPRGTEASPERRQQIELVAKLYDEGLSKTEMMRRTGLSMGQVAQTTQRAKDLGLIKTKKPLGNTEKMSPERSEQVMLVAKLYDEGATVEEIMEQTGLSRDKSRATAGYAVRMGLIENRRPVGRIVPPERRQQVKLFAKLYDEGATISEIMEQTGLSTRAGVQSTAAFADRLGLIENRRPLGRIPSPELRQQAELIAKLYDEGATIEGVMERTGLSKEKVGTAVRRAYELGLIKNKRPNGKRMSPERRQQVVTILRLWDQGFSTREIIDRVGVDRGTVWNALSLAQSRGLAKKAPDYSESQLDRARTVAALYQNGTTYAEMATTTGMKLGAIYYFLGMAQELGLLQSLNRKNSKFSEGRTRRITEVARLLNEGMTHQEIAEELNISRREVVNDAEMALKMRLLRKTRRRLRGSGLSRRLASKERKVKLVPATDASNSADPQLPRSEGEASASMSAELIKRLTNEQSQLELISSLPGVEAKSTARNGVLKPYLLAAIPLDLFASHEDRYGVPRLEGLPEEAINRMGVALRNAGLGAYSVKGSSVAKIQGPIVADFADRFVGPSAVAKAISGTFPTVPEILDIYAINALVRARAEFLAESTMSAEEVDSALQNSIASTSNNGGGKLWTMRRNGEFFSFGRDNELRYFGTIDPFNLFSGKSIFFAQVLRAMPEAVRSRVIKTGHLNRESAWENLDYFDKVEIREDDAISRNFAPMVRSQMETAKNHALSHTNLVKKWAQSSYDLMKEAGLTDEEVATVINEAWLYGTEFLLSRVVDGYVLHQAAELSMKAFGSRYSPISPLQGADMEEEDYGLHEFFHHYLGQGFTRHGEYVAFRGPVDLVDSYHNRLQWAWNTDGQLGTFVSKVMKSHFGDKTGTVQQNETEKIFDDISRAIFDRLREMLSDEDEKQNIFSEVFPEMLGASTENEKIIKDLIMRQFVNRARGAGRTVREEDFMFSQFLPVLTLMTSTGFLVPRKYWPYGSEDAIDGTNPVRTWSPDVPESS